MAFSLIDETDGAVPIAALTKTEFPAWLETAPERERNWLTSIGFSADAGKHALLPGESGKLARVLVGLGDGADAEGRLWALAGLPTALPEASYRLDEPGPQLREMLLVLSEQRPEHPQPRLLGFAGRRPRIAVDGPLVQVDQVFFRRDDNLQGQHIVAEGRGARQRIGAGEHI